MLIVVVEPPHVVLDSHNHKMNRLLYCEYYEIFYVKPLSNVTRYACTYKLLTNN